MVSFQSDEMMQMSLALVVLTLLWSGATAQSGCTTSLISLTPCLNYVSGNSSTPSSSCCSSLANVVKTQPQCLCTLVNGNSASLGVTINQTLALQLPSVCKVQTPPVSRCNAAAGPTASSTPSDSTLTPSSDASPPSTSSSSGSKTTSSDTPTTTTSTTSDSMTLKLPVFLTSVALLVSITKF